jgi:hypothetical protein
MHNPDIYFQDPVTGHYQHLFHVVDSELLMCPSSVMQNGKSSASVLCDIRYDTMMEALSCKLHVSWKGDLVQLTNMAANKVLV